MPGFTDSFDIFDNPAGKAWLDWDTFHSCFQSLPNGQDILDEQKILLFGGISQDFSDEIFDSLDVAHKLLIIFLVHPILNIIDENIYYSLRDSVSNDSFSPDDINILTGSLVSAFSSPLDSWSEEDCDVRRASLRQGILEIINFYSAADTVSEEETPSHEETKEETKLEETQSTDGQSLDNNSKILCGELGSLIPNITNTDIPVGEKIKMFEQAFNLFSQVKWEMENKSDFNWDLLDLFEQREKELSDLRKSLGLLHDNGDAEWDDDSDEVDYIYPSSDDGSVASNCSDAFSEDGNPEDLESLPVVSDEASVTRIQALARGFLARRRLLDAPENPADTRVSSSMTPGS